MKRYTITFICIAALTFTGCVLADYANPPMWEAGLNFTHQSWDFYESDYTEPDGPPLPLAPDGLPEWQNAYGTPGLLEVDYDVPPEYEYLIPAGLVAWKVSYEADESERIGYYGGMGHTHMTLYIPAPEAVAGYDNVIWVQMAYYGRMDGGQTYDMQVARDGEFTDTAGIALVSEEVEVLDEPVGAISRWYRATRVYRFLSNPAGVYVRLSAFRQPPSDDHTMGGASMIDEVDVDTKMVLAADINADDTVDLADMALLGADWLVTAADMPADIDRSGTVDVDDVLLLAEEWLSSSL